MKIFQTLRIGSKYKEAIDDLGTRYETKFTEFSELAERKNKLLENEINLHKHINAQLKEENLMLRKKIAVLYYKKSAKIIF